MLTFILLSLLSAPQTIEEIKKGDCLTFNDMQRIVGVHSKDIYLADEGECGIDYLKEDSVAQNNLCSENLQTGIWQREIAEHKKFGMFFPWSPPCFASVTKVDFTNYELSRVNPLDEDQALPICSNDDFFVNHIQTETLRTKKWEVGQGYMYLPNPLLVRDEKYILNEDNGYERTSCYDRKLIVSYEGWGGFESKWWEYPCDSETPRICREAEMKSSENEDGETCILVKKIYDCQK